MHKAIYLEGRIGLTIKPAGPILIKAGETGGADPTRPDMEFVRTQHRGAAEVYIPGPSLKGVVRAQAERIARSLDGQTRYASAQQEAREHYGDGFVPPLADNPVLSDKEYREYDGSEGADMRFSSSVYFNKHKEITDTAQIYRLSSFVSQMFGHTSLAGRVRFADAYGDNVVAEERNGVAIDRIYGSVAVGPFNYETAVAGTFPTTIDLKNVTLAQLALLGLSLRDLAEGRVAIGFGKSRGLGRVKVEFTNLTLRYPTCEVAGDRLQLLNGRDIAAANQLVGVGVFERQAAYGMPSDDKADMPADLSYLSDEEWGMGVAIQADGDKAVRSVWKACMPAWKRKLGWSA